MKKFILRPKQDLGSNNPWDPWYDKCFGMVVIAENEKEAREYAVANCSDEGEKAWRDDTYSTCEDLETINQKGVLIEDIARA